MSHKSGTLSCLVGAEEGPEDRRPGTQQVHSLVIVCSQIGFAHEYGCILLCPKSAANLIGSTK